MKNEKKNVLLFSCIPLLFFGGVGAAYAELKGSCPSGYTLNLTGAYGHVYCLKKITQTYRDYATYTPCTPPGVYKTGDEQSNGRDRCNTYGVLSPALPCVGININLQVKRGVKDACYYNKSRTISTHADVILTN